MSEKLDVKAILAEVQENQRRLKSCPRHLFNLHEITRFGMKVTCENCGGTMQLTDMGHYIDGYRAGGGDANDIMPGYDKMKGT